MDFLALQKRLNAFAQERDWEQFHSPKNLAIALSVEASELLEIFQWMSEAESHSLSAEQRESVAQEVADVQIYLARLADVLQLDIESAVDRKMEINADKYPAETVRGSSKKYTAYRDE
jgi:NTP pyrophosphatase (non-canonical NTP hydrolase)